MKELKPVRCTNCNKLLAKIKGAIEIKCTRCNTIVKTEK